MNKPSAAVLTAAILLLLTGCAGAPDEVPSVPESVATTTVEETPTPEPAEKMSAANSADITAPGEVCDPGNANDAICAAFYPDQVVLNMAARAGGEFAALSDAEKIDRARQACETDDADPLIVKAGAVAYCNENAGGPDTMPDMVARLVSFYQAMGEDAAKAHFNGHTMPTPAELGY